MRVGDSGGEVREVDTDMGLIQGCVVRFVVLGIVMEEGLGY